MIKITITPASDSRLLIVAEGQLTRDCALQLMVACSEHLGADRAIALDLASIDFADRAGLTIIRDLLARGCTLERCSGFLQTLLASDPFAPEPGVSDERRLLARMRRGDEQAFEETVRRCGPRMLGTARRILKDEDDANDAVQDAFVSAFRALDNFAGDSLISTWLHRIVVNSALMHLRREKRRAEDSIDTISPNFESGNEAMECYLVSDETTATVCERRDERAMVRRCVERLPENYRTVIMLRDVEELDTSEAAIALGLTVTALKVRLHRARQALKVVIEREMGIDASGASPSNELALDEDRSAA